MHQILIGFAGWLNTTVPESGFLLNAVRFFFTFAILMTLWSGLRLCLRYPTVLAFWMASAPLPLLLAYYAGQLYVAHFSEVDATFGLLWANLSVGFAFAGYWTLLGMLRKLYREKYGSGFSLRRYLFGSAEQPGA